MRLRFYFLIIFASALLVFFAFNPSFLSNWAVDWRSGDLVQNFNRLNSRNKELENEIGVLRADLDSLQKLSNFKKPARSYQYLLAGVFSRYPFNAGNRLVVDRGSGDGVRVGMPVLADQSVLIGRVSRIGVQTSEVITVFNPEWQEAVLIGDSAEEGILTGGSDPKISFVGRDTAITPGVAVRNGSVHFPINLLIAEISEIIDQPDAPFKEGRLKFPYQLSDLKKVLILTNYAQ